MTTQRRGTFYWFALAVALAACEERSQEPPHTLDPVGHPRVPLEQRAHEWGERAERAVEGAGERAEQAAERIEEAVGEAAERARPALRELELEGREAASEVERAIDRAREELDRRSPSAPRPTSASTRETPVAGEAPDPALEQAEREREQRRERRERQRAER